MSLIGLYNYNSKLFDKMTMPDGIDKDIVVTNILQEAGEFEVLYPDWDFMQYMIGHVANKWNRTFQKWYEALQLEYNPIENYDRYEHWTDESERQGTDTGTIKTDGTDKGTVNHAGTDTGTVGNAGSSSGSGSSTTDDFVTTYDSDTLHQNTQQKISQSQNGNTSNTETRNLSNSDLETRDLTNGNIETRDLANSDDANATHDGRMHGNIGVTTSQQMLESELELDYWNLYDHIAEIFVTELTIPVY